VAIKTNLTGFGIIGVYAILLLETERNNCPVLLNQVATCNYIYIYIYIYIYVIYGTVEFLYHMFDDKEDVTLDAMGGIYNALAYTCNIHSHNIMYGLHLQNSIGWCNFCLIKLPR